MKINYTCTCKNNLKKRKQKFFFSIEKKKERKQLDITKRQDYRFKFNKKQCFKFHLDIVRTSFDLDPKTGLGSGPTSPNNEFVERRRKN